MCPGLSVLPELATKKNSTSIHMFVKQRAPVPVALVILRTRLKGCLGRAFRNSQGGTSLAVQWLRICLAMQGV